MKIRAVLLTTILTIVWIVLREDFSLVTIISGVVFSCIVLWFCAKYLPLGRISNVRFSMLAGYPFFLLGQIYVAGFYVIRLILSGAEVKVIKMRTTLKNEGLRVVLVDSITLTPGSIALDLDGDEITLLWLKDSRRSFTNEERDELLKGALERRLHKAEK